MFYVRIDRQPAYGVVGHLAMAVFLCSLIATAGQAHGQSAYCPIGTPTISQPQAGDVLGSGGELCYAWCYHPGDQDKDADENIVQDDVTVYWAKVGPATFKWGDFIGHRVLLQTTNGSGDLTLTSYAKNNYMDGESDDCYSEWTIPYPSYSWDDGGDRPTKYAADSDATPDDVTVKVVKVDTLVWETYDDNTTLDTLPDASKRIYPGVKNLDDFANWTKRKKVTVKATVTPVVADADVTFSKWDVDDPYSDTAGNPVDDDDGPDNYGLGSSMATYAATNASGEATVTLTVSVKPGDNFKIAAATSALRVDEMTQLAADGHEALPDTVKLSAMLTVWRKLHVQVDSMGKEYVTGQSTSLEAMKLTDDPQQWQVTPSQFADYNEDWDLNPNTGAGNWFDVLGNTDDDIYIAAGDLTTDADTGDPYRVEFQGFPGDGSDPLRGEIPQPNTSALADAFDDAYVTVDLTTVSENNNSDAPWHYNLDSDTDDWEEYMYELRALRTTASEFWYVHIVGGYDNLHPDDDNDPSTEVSADGGTSISTPQSAMVFNETARDTAAQHGWTPAQTTHSLKGVVLHEIGEHFNLDNDAGENNNTHVMWAATTDAQEDKYKDIPLVFNEDNKYDIRDSPVGP